MGAFGQPQAGGRGRGRMEPRSRSTKGGEGRAERAAAPGGARASASPDGDVRRLIPRTDALLDDPRLAEASRRLGAPVVKASVREAQQRARAGRIAPRDVADEAVALLPDTAC